MGFMEDLFMGSDSEIKVESFLTPEQQEMFRGMLEDAQGGVSATPWEFQSGWPTFSEEAPGPNKAQQLSLAGLESMAAGGSSGTAAGGMVQEGRDSISDILGRDATDFDDYFRKNVEDPLMEALNRPGSGGLSTLKKGQVGSGNLFGGAYQDGLQTLLQDTYDTMARERSGMALHYRDQDTQHQLAAMGLLPQLESIEPNLMSSMMMTGEIPRQAEMAQWQGRLDDFTRQVEEAWRRRMYASGLASTQTTATMGDPGRPGLFETLLQSQAQAFGTQTGDLMGGGMGGFLGG